jgi:hypothetical protein
LGFGWLINRSRLTELFLEWWDREKDARSKRQNIESDGIELCSDPDE